MTRLPRVRAFRSGRSPVAALLLCGVAAAGAATAQTTRGADALYTPEDLRFLQHMIVHHEQALDLTALVPARTPREALRSFARHVERAQQAEIDQMQALLALAADRGMTVPHHEHHGTPMPGLLSQAQMDALAAASGADFERLWLEGMIVHHEGALTMGLEQQKRQFDEGRRPFGIDVLVDEILVVQRAEITMMKAWLTEWGLHGRGLTSAYDLARHTAPRHRQPEHGKGAPTPSPPAPGWDRPVP